MLGRWFRRINTGPRHQAPFLLRAGAVLAGLWAVTASLVLLGTLGIATFARGGRFTWNDRLVSREEFLTHLPLLMLVFSVPVGFCVAIAFGVWRERSWTRHAVLAFWLIVAAVLIGQGLAGEFGLAMAVGWSTVYVATVGWYFYRKPNVVKYYRALEAQERGSAPRRSN